MNNSITLVFKDYAIRGKIAKSQLKNKINKLLFSYNFSYIIGFKKTTCIIRFTTEEDLTYMRLLGLDKELYNIVFEYHTTSQIHELLRQSHDELASQLKKEVDELISNEIMEAAKRYYNDATKNND